MTFFFITFTVLRLNFQLRQVEHAISHARSKEQLNELTSLRDSLVELIALTGESNAPERTAGKPFDEEYALFKVGFYILRRLGVPCLFL